MDSNSRSGSAPAMVRCALAAMLLHLVAAMPREAPVRSSDSSRGSRSRRLYDRGCLFSPEGRIYQVEYAQRAVERGGAAFAAVSGDRRYAILGAVRSKALREAGALLPTRDDGWRERVHRIDEHVACASCGIVPDARQLLRALQRLATEHRRTWGTRAPVGLVAARLSDYVQSATLRTGNRPFGAAFLMAGLDDDDHALKLYLTDPAGFFDEYDAVATAGDAPAEARDALLAAAAANADTLQTGGLDARAARRAVRDALKATLEKENKGTGVLRPGDVELAYVELRDDGSVVSEVMAAHDVAALLAEDDISDRDHPEVSFLSEDSQQQQRHSDSPGDDASPPAEK